MSENEYKISEAKLRSIAAEAFKDSDQLPAQPGASFRFAVTPEQSARVKMTGQELERRMKARFASGGQSSPPAQPSTAED